MIDGVINCPKSPTTEPRCHSDQVDPQICLLICPSPTLFPGSLFIVIVCALCYETGYQTSEKFACFLLVKSYPL